MDRAQRHQRIDAQAAVSRGGSGTCRACSPRIRSSACSASSTLERLRLLDAKRSSVDAPDRRRDRHEPLAAGL
ncbi:hypothetical protein WT08_11495 [Burkholderia sp. MSMB1552]|nr:hypothetical protein AQ610_28120 [Burkholderia humptydooensis]KVN12746.1 hypothetical protein WT08_11495 [Burkholderia sp. MSMB1552]KWZ49407.1 hypothetical protein WS92_18030 [Burkholderia sp. MSMB1588]